MTGLNEVIVPIVQSSERHTIKDFIEIVTTSLQTVNSEHKFENELRKADLLGPVQKCALFAKKEELGDKMCLMPVAFQIKKFFEMPEVFQKIMDNTTKIQHQNELNHFINGTLWKEKLTNYKPDDIVIPYHFYVDGAQMNHALGPHCGKGQHEFNYYSFPTIPTEYQSRLENIFVASLFPGQCHVFVVCGILS